MAETDENKIELAMLRRLLTPSFTSATLAIILAVLVVGRALLNQLYSDSGPGAEIVKAIAASNQDFINNHQLPTNNFVSNALIFVIWAFVGALVYMLVIEVARLINEVNGLNKQLHYVHSDRRQVTKDFAERLSIRVLGLGFLYATLALLLKFVLPYALACATTVAASVTIVNLFYLLIGIFMLLVNLHIVTVLMRIIVLRPRIFSSEIYR